MANLKFFPWLLKKTILLMVASIIYAQNTSAESAALAVTKAQEVSLSEVVNALKKEDAQTKATKEVKSSKEPRMAGFRINKSQPEATTTAIPKTLAEKEAESSSDREIKRKKSELDELKEENKRLEHDILALMGEDPEIKEWTVHGLPDITPAFPAYARLIGNDGIVHAELDFATSSWCFNDDGKVVDLSQLVVGFKPVEVQDISVVSRLARMSSKINSNSLKWDAIGTTDQEKLENKLLVSNTSVGSNLSTLAQIYLSITTTGTASPATTALASKIINTSQLNVHDLYLNRIADTKLEFKVDSKSTTLNWNLTYLFKKLYSLGIEIPVIFQSHKFSMVSRLSQEALDELNSAEVKAANQAGDFFAKFPNGLDDFYRDLLAKKGFNDRERHNLFGVGDISFFVNRKINAPDTLKAGIIGVGITAPTGVKTDFDYVWPCALGNGGFWELRGHTSLFWRCSAFWNPHAFAEVRFRIGSTVKRRAAPMVVHKKLKVQNSDNITIQDLQQTPGIIQNPAARDFAEAESVIPAFAQDMRNVDINHGLKVRARVGNLFDKVGVENAYLDLFYEVEFEQEDNVSYRQSPELDIKNIMLNSQRYAHSVGGVYCYRLNNNALLEAKFSHTALGKNTERVTKLGCGIQYNF